MADEDENRGFTIVDKRDGDEAAEDASPEAAERHVGEPPPADFTGLLLSLGNAALYHLGLVADPQTGEAAPVQLPLARNTIDTLEVLQQKTAGNLDADEEQLLTSLLTELRLRFVEVSGG